MSENDELIATIKREFEELTDLKLPSSKRRVEMLLGWSQQKLNYLATNGRERNVGDLQVALDAIRMAKKDTLADLQRIEEDTAHKAKIFNTLQILLNM